MNGLSSYFSQIIEIASFPALFALGALALGVAVVRRCAELRRRSREAGFVSAAVAILFVAAMTINSFPTQAEKTNIVSRIDYETGSLAFFGGMLLSSLSSGDEGEEDSGAESESALCNETNTIPFLASLTNTIPHWSYCVYEDGVRIRFDDDWRFPYGTDHLASVEVMSYGAVWSNSFNMNAIASFAAKLSMVPNGSEFRYGRTESNSYEFAWLNGRDARINGNEFTGAIELKRNGDARIFTGAGVVTLPYTVPFAHDGFGQDDEWVCANFTNAEEILSFGYESWAEDQIGIDLTNGIYLFTASFPAVPPEPTRLFVGDYSVCVTNAGEYSFVLEKGAEYEFGTWPYNGDVDYWVQDDMGASSQLLTASWNYGNAPGEWSIDGGWCRLYIPGTNNYGYCCWMPILQGSPNLAHLGADAFPLALEAVLADYCGSVAPTYQWTASYDNIQFTAPNAQRTIVNCNVQPSWSSITMSVRVDFGNYNLLSEVDSTYGIYDKPQITVSIDMQDLLLKRSCWMDGSSSANARIAFRCDVITNGTIEAWVDSGADRIDSQLKSRVVCDIRDASTWEREYSVDGILESQKTGDVKLCCRFVDLNGVEVAYCSKNITVIRPCGIEVPSAPTTGLVVLQGSSVGVQLSTIPQIDSCQVEWCTSRRRAEIDYDDWSVVNSGSANESLAFNSPGIYAIRARTICTCQSNQVEFIRRTSEGWSDVVRENIGPGVVGDRDHIGVSSALKLISIRNEALLHMNVAEYTKKAATPAKHGFSAVGRNTWKCNLFVAHVVTEAGVHVPVYHTITHSWPFEDTYFPPLANDWGADDNQIPGWVRLPANGYPEPGMIAARPQPGGTGHCGIVDYDGWVISARSKGVSRNATKMLDGSCRYNKPEETNE